tara:strand:+ start:765 stop:1556 length:792 start_codon:yes stop_codon:yes gene_type:complete
MGKFINIPLPISNATATMPAEVAVTNSKTTTAAAAGKLTDTGGTPNFLTTVTVGDIIFPTGSVASVYSTVTAVDSDSVLSIEGTGTALLEATPQAYLIYSDASAHTLENAAGTFLTDVNVGDLVVNPTEGFTGKVTKVLSDTAVLVDIIMFNDNATDDGIIISQSGYGGRLVNLENIGMVIPTAGGAGDTPVALQYKTTATDVVTITISQDQAAYSWSTAFTDLMVETLQSEWKHVVAEMPMVTAPVVAGEPAYLYATDVTLA